jgi:hypothetical protein
MDTANDLLAWLKTEQTKLKYVGDKLYKIRFSDSCLIAPTCFFSGSDVNDRFAIYHSFWQGAVPR